MKHVDRYEPVVDLEAVKRRLDLVRQRRVPDRDAVADLRVDITSLLAEFNRLMQIERLHRCELADLLDAARDALAAADRGERFALYRLNLEVDRHREITADDLDAWRDWSDLLDPSHDSSNHHPTPTERRR